MWCTHPHPIDARLDLVWELLPQEFVDVDEANAADNALNRDLWEG